MLYIKPFAAGKKFPITSMATAAKGELFNHSAIGGKVTCTILNQTLQDCSLAPRPTTGSGQSYLSVEEKLKVYGLPL